MNFDYTYKKIFICICSLAAIPEVVADVLTPHLKDGAPPLLSCLDIVAKKHFGDVK